MKKTLIYGALSGVALYLYLQLQKKKKLSAKETSSTKQDDATGTSIPSGTDVIKTIKTIPLPIPKLGDPTKRDSIKSLDTLPPMLLTTPKGEGDGFSVKNDAPTPPAPTVEPVIIPQPKPIFTKPVVPKGIVDIKDFVIPRLKKRPTGLIR